jgi:ferritin
MQGDASIIETLNDVLTAELTAINQYFIHHKMCQNWGYARLSKKKYEESIEEMKHADRLRSMRSGVSTRELDSLGRRATTAPESYSKTYCERKRSRSTGTKHNFTSSRMLGGRPISPK